MKFPVGMYIHCSEIQAVLGHLGIALVRHLTGPRNVGGSNSKTKVSHGIAEANNRTALYVAEVQPPRLRE